MSVFVRTAVAGLATAAAITAAPMALADPPAEPVNTEQAPSTPGRLAPPVGEIPASKDGVPPLQPIAAPEGSILDVGVLPLFEEAHWKNVPQWDWGSPFLTGVEVCSRTASPTRTPSMPLRVPTFSTSFWLRVTTATRRDDRHRVVRPVRVAERLHRRAGVIQELRRFLPAA